MKKTKWIAALCLVLSVLTVGTTFARYATTLSDSFLLSIVAQVYNLTLDANGGTFDDGTTKMSLNQTGQKDFGQHSNLSQNLHTFLGWSTEKDSIVCNFEKDQNIVVSQHDTTLYAVWGLDVSFETNEKGTGDDSPVHVFQEKDGDTICIDLTLQAGNYERLFIPLTNLDPNAVYKISFTYEGSGSYHDYTYGLFGWKVIDPATENVYKSSIKNLCDILGSSQFNKALDSINHLVKKNKQENEPFDLNLYQEDYFMATDSTMYLFFEYSNVMDGTESYQYLKNLKIEKITTNVSSVKFNNSEALMSSSGYFDGDAGSYNFTMKSLLGTYERLGFKIPQTFDTSKEYMVSFTFENNATTKTYGSSSYFGFMVDGDNSCLNSVNSITKNDYWQPLTPGTTGNYEYIFTPSSSEMYMLFDISSGVDGKTADYAIKNFKITEIVSAISASNDTDIAGSTIAIDYSVIDDTNLDWHPVSDYDDMQPRTGEDYCVAFQPKAGYILSEYVTVDIDGTVYQVYTDGLEHRQIPEDGTELPPIPTFEPTSSTLTIPAILLTEETQIVRIAAAAVPVEVEPTETPSCTCGVRCTDLNADCPVCSTDISTCIGEEPDTTPICTCETKCTDLNADCAVCGTDVSSCGGTESQFPADDPVDEPLTPANTETPAAGETPSPASTDTLEQENTEIPGTPDPAATPSETALPPETSLPEYTDPENDGE